MCRRLLPSAGDSVPLPEARSAMSAIPPIVPTPARES
jgi:hypothetical protein